MNRIEEILQQQIIEAWNNSHTKLHSSYPERQRLYCVYNNSINTKEGNKMRSMGVRKGVSDLEYIMDDGRTHYIELKTEDGKQSEEQIEFQELCNKLNAPYSLVRSYSEFWTTIGINEPQPDNTLLPKLPERLR